MVKLLILPAILAVAVLLLGACSGAESENLVWRYETGGNVTSSPAVADGVVYVGTRANYVYALDSATGDLLWRYEAGGWVHSSPAVEGGVVYVGSRDNYVYALDSTTGELRQLSPVVS